MTMLDVHRERLSRSESRALDLQTRSSGTRPPLATNSGEKVRLGHHRHPASANPAPLFWVRVVKGRVRELPYQLALDPRLAKCLPYRCNQCQRIVAVQRDFEIWIARLRRRLAHSSLRNRW